MFTIQNANARLLTGNASTGSETSGHLLLTLNSIKVNSGNTGLTILAVGYTGSDYVQKDGSSKKFETKGAVQVASLADNNLLYVFKNGADFINRKVHEGPYSLSNGENFVIEETEPGYIIGLTKGGYGYSEQRKTTDGIINVSPMPLLSLGLAFTQAQFYAYRDSNEPKGDKKGLVHIVCGPSSTRVSLIDPVTEKAVLRQDNIKIKAFSHKTLVLDGNKEYRIESSEPIMACVHSSMGDNLPKFHDSRLVMPVTDDGMCWTKTARMSARFPSTKVSYFNNGGSQGGTNGGVFTIPGPGSTVNLNSIVGAGDSAPYKPKGCTRFISSHLVSASTGGDGAGAESTPLVPTSSFSQKIPIVGLVKNRFGPECNSITVFSPYEGSFKLYSSGDPTTPVEVLTGSSTTISEIPLERRAGSSTDQRIPASAQIASSDATNSADGIYGLQADLKGGFIVSNVPCSVIVNNDQKNLNNSQKFLSNKGNLVEGVRSSCDETLMFGITPEEIKAEIRLVDNELFRRTIDSTNGNVTWVRA